MNALLSGSGHAPPRAWEYQIYEPTRGSSKEIIAAHLSDLGFAGWELVGVIPGSLLFAVEMGNGLPAPAQVHFILKRPVVPVAVERPSFKARLGGIVAATLGDGALAKMRRVSSALNRRT